MASVELVTTEASMSSISVEAIDHIVLNVRNVAVSLQWYSTVPGMKHQIITAECGIEKNISLFGKQKINIRPVNATQEEWFTAKKAVDGTSDLCFLVVDGAMEKMRSVYCRDPDGSLIEIASY